MGDGLTDEEWPAMLKPVCDQRYVDFVETHQALTPRMALLQTDETTDPLSREFMDFYSTAKGYHLWFNCRLYRHRHYVLGRLSLFNPSNKNLTKGNPANSRRKGPITIF
jgi:hypothetical protein